MRFSRKNIASSFVELYISGRKSGRKGALLLWNLHRIAIRIKNFI